MPTTRRGFVSWVALLIFGAAPAVAATPVPRAAADATGVLGTDRHATAGHPASRLFLRRAAKTWTGATSTDWSLAGNWSPATAPAAGDDITIPANLASGNYPVVTATSSVHTITLATGAGTAPTLMLSSGTLTVGGNLAVNAGTFTVAGGTVAITGGSVSVAGTLTISGGTMLSSVAMTETSGGVVNLSGTGILNMSTAVGVAPTDNYTIQSGGVFNQTGGSAYFHDLSMNGGSPGGIYNQSGGTLYQYHDFKNLGTFSSTGGTISFEGAGGGANFPTNPGPTQFFNVVLDVDPGFPNNNVNFSVAGDWTANTAVNMALHPTQVTFNGSGAQNIGGTATTTFDSLVVNKPSNAATLTHSENITSGSVTVAAGTLDLSSFTINRTAPGGSFIVQNGATVIIGGSNGFPTNYSTVTLGANSTVVYDGTNQTITSENYGNLQINGSGNCTLPGGTFSGVFAVSGTATVTAGGNMTFNSDFTVASGSVFNASTFTMTFNANFTNDGTYTAGTSSAVFSGTSAQTLAGASSTTFNNLTLNNAAGLVMNSTTTVDATMTFTSGNITTSSNILIIGPTGSVTRTSGFVVGNERKQITASGAVSKTFELGSGSNYLPVTVALTGVAGQASDSTQYLTVSSTGTEHPAVARSGINAAKSVNRYWTFTKGGNWTFTNYAATFTFVAGDVDGGATTGNFLVRQYNGSAWNTTTVGTRNATNTQATATTASGDFAIGEATSTGTAVGTSGTPSIAGNSVTFTATATQTGGGAVPSEGTIAFRDGGADCSTGTILQAATTVNASGVVTYVTTALSAGAHTVRACYDDSGSGLFPSSNGTVAQTVNGYGASITATPATAGQLPSNGTNYTVSFIIQNTGTTTDSYDLLLTRLPGTYLTTVSITGTSITQGANKDSARVANLAANALDTAVVTYSVAMAANGSKDTLVFKARSVGNPPSSGTGRLTLTVTTPVIAIVKTRTPGGTQVPGTDITYADTVTNNGSASAATVISTDSISTLLQFKVGSVVTSFPVSVAVEYSNDGGTTWVYTPVSGGCSAVSGYDACVNRVRVRLLAALSFTGPNNTGYFKYIARIR